MCGENIKNVFKEEEYVWGEKKKNVFKEEEACVGTKAENCLRKKDDCAREGRKRIRVEKEKTMFLEENVREENGRVCSRS